MRKPLVMGNWKMNLNHEEGAALAASLLEKLDGQTEAVEVVVCPPFTALAHVGKVLAAGAARMGLGAQDVHWEPSGAFTGEVSAPMLQALGCTYVIIGHSERRRLFAESDQRVAAKTKAALAAQLTPVICVGESLSERKAGQAETVVGQQLDAIVPLMAENQRPLVIAYEPVWAIGTGEAASPADAQQMAAMIRKHIAVAAPQAADRTRILYGGSVQPDNARSFFEQPDIDGALVGGASLQAESFIRIVQAVATH